MSINEKHEHQIMHKRAFPWPHTNVFNGGRRSCRGHAHSQSNRQLRRTWYHAVLYAVRTGMLVLSLVRVANHPHVLLYLT